MGKGTGKGKMNFMICGGGACIMIIGIALLVTGIMGAMTVGVMLVVSEKHRRWGCRGQECAGGGKRASARVNAYERR